MNIIIVFIFLFVSCLDAEPKFKSGDCLIKCKKAKESWEVQTCEKMKVIQVGNENYQIEWANGYRSTWEFELAEYAMRKSVCQ